ncbi:MAG: hypothetical protein ACOYNN_17890 [Terrimicrobiaceae bacterium]
MDTVKFTFGERVRHRASDEDDKPGIVTGIMFRPWGVTYEVSWGPHGESSHYDIELERTDEVAAK